MEEFISNYVFFFKKKHIKNYLQKNNFFILYK